MIRPRKFAWLAGALVLLLLVAWPLLHFALQPQRVTGLILDRLGNALGLEITASGTSDYRLRGTPMLVVRNVVAREPGAALPLLLADRVYLSLPWSTLRSRGSDLTVERVELDRPLIDLTALQHWLDRRPPGETRIPTLTEGLHVRDGRVIAGGWSLDALTLELPTLYPDRPVLAHVSGRYRSGTVKAPMALDVFASQPASEAALGISGTITIERTQWELPAHVVLSGMLHLNNGVRLEHTKLAAQARYESAQTRLPFALGLAGVLRYADGQLSLAPAGIAVRGNGFVPHLNARGAMVSADTLQLQLAGHLQAWPAAWPELPAPIGRSTSPLPFQLEYAGQPDLSGVATLQLSRDAASFDGRFRLSDMTAWIDADESSPLPPLDGRLTTPTLEIAGAQLQGVEITLDDIMLDDPDIQPVQ